MTYEPIPYARAASGPVLEGNRRGWLIAFGIVSILIGAMSGCVAVVVPLVLLLTPMGQAGLVMPVVEAVVAVAVYTATATLFIWAGVDSIRCRRWVRPMVVAVGWVSAVGTVFTVVAWAMVMPEVPIMAGPGGAPASDVAVMAWAGGAAMVVFGIVLPGVFVWFYSTAAVRRTLAAYDLGPSWAERCPLPVFVAVVSLVLGAFSTATLAPKAVAPVFGTYVEGPGAVALVLAAAGLLLVAAALTYRLMRTGLILAMGVIAAGFASTVVTLWAGGMTEFYRRGGWSSYEVMQMSRSPVLSGDTPAVVVIVMGLTCLGFLGAIYPYLGNARGRDEAVGE